MSIQLASSGARSFYAHSRAECLDVGDIRLTTIPTFIRGFVCGRVDEAVMEVYVMKEGRRPEFCWKAGSIKERANFDREGVVGGGLEHVLQ